MNIPTLNIQSEDGGLTVINILDNILLHIMKKSVEVGISAGGEHVQILHNMKTISVSYSLESELKSCHTKVKKNQNIVHISHTMLARIKLTSEFQLHNDCSINTFTSHVYALCFVIDVLPFYLCFSLYLIDALFCFPCWLSLC
jgi:hypothetical protein